MSRSGSNRTGAASNTSPADRDPDGAGAGDHVGVRHDVAAIRRRTRCRSRSRWHVAADTLTVLGSAIAASRWTSGSSGSVDWRRRQRLEADEQVGQAGVVEEPRERRRRSRSGRAGSRRAPRTNERGLGLAGEGRARAGGEQPAGQPDDEQCLRRRRRTRRARGRSPRTRPSPSMAAARPTHRRADRLADPDREQDAAEHDERAKRRVDRGERLLEVRAAGARR